MVLPVRMGATTGKGGSVFCRGVPITARTGALGTATAAGKTTAETTAGTTAGITAGVAGAATVRTGAETSADWVAFGLNLNFTASPDAVGAGISGRGGGANKTGGGNAGAAGSDFGGPNAGSAADPVVNPSAPGEGEDLGPPSTGRTRGFRRKAGEGGVCSSLICGKRENFGPKREIKKDSLAVLPPTNQCFDLFFT